ncbi:MAG: DUF4965 domain-containing protein [Bryobacteraceae bacterium]|nr:DUF4965 domain-containing protein [Bryobacterales bacterium]NUN01526.1 DUF4965 domain-containing protein [Bryobacteraceae bacterium]
MRAPLRPVPDRAQSRRCRWAFASHDLSQYLLANGLESQMPLEESGNMLTTMAALA